MELNDLLFSTGTWIATASIILLLITVIAFVMKWGIRFRLVGITSFGILLALSCWAFAISYTSRVHIKGAVNVPIVFDNGGNLVVASANKILPSEAIIPTVNQLALNIKGSGRNSPNRLVHVRLRQIEHINQGLDQPIVLAEAILNLNTGDIYLSN